MAASAWRSTLGTFSFTGVACIDHVLNGIDLDPMSGMFYATIVCDFTGRVRGFGTVEWLHASST